MTSNPEGGAHRRATVLAVGGSVFDARQVVSRVGELEHLLHSGRPREQFHRAAVLAGVRAALKQEAQTRGIDERQIAEVKDHLPAAGLA